MRKLLLVLLAKMFCLTLIAVPANPKPATFIQSDGSEITVHLRGDEFFSWFETVDGYTLLRKENGDFVYAELNQFEELIPSRFLASNPNNRTPEKLEFLQNVGRHTFARSRNIQRGVERKNARQAEQRQRMSAAPGLESKNQTTGIRRQIVILAEYQDVKFRTNPVTGTPFSYAGAPSYTSSQLFDSIMNGKNYTANGAMGSVQQYFYDNSMGQLTIETTVFGPITLPHNRIYYGGYPESDAQVQQMITDALQILHNQSVDFTPFVNPERNVVDGVHVIFAGCGEESYQLGCPDEAIWSHKFVLPVGQRVFGGANFLDYSCSPELSGGNTSTTPTHIGVIAHEIGHTLGLWDMYDTREGGNWKGLGPWSLMSEGSWNNSGRTPPYLNAFERYMLGWTTPIVLDYDKYYEITLPPLGPNSDISYVFYAKNASGNPILNERFYLENRNTTSTGLWDSRILSSGGTPGGLMVYHMDSTRPAVWTNNMVNTTGNSSGRENFRIISAKGTNTTFNQDPFSQTTMDSLTDNSTPNTTSWAGIPSGIPIRNITRNTTNNSVSFTVGNEPPCAETSFEYDTTFCQGSGFDFNGRWLTATGTYRDTLENAAGCDSIVILNLTRLENSRGPVILDTIYQGDSLKFFGAYYKIAGTFEPDTLNSVGCDSVVTLILTVIPRPVSIVPIELTDSKIIKIIPNPIRTNEEFTVTIPISDHVLIEIFNLNGELIFSKTNHQNTELSIPGIRHPGSYILRISSRDFQTKSVKIIVVP